MTRGALAVKKWRERKMATDPEGFRAIRREQRRRWYHKNKKEIAKTSRKRQLKIYGLTEEQYDTMLAKQNSVCAVCGLPPREERLSVDHDHKTDQVRGRVHKYPCNIILGHLDNHSEIIEQAKQFLTRLGG